MRICVFSTSDRSERFVEVRVEGFDSADNFVGVMVFNIDKTTGGVSVASKEARIFDNLEAALEEFVEFNMEHLGINPGTEIKLV